MRRFALALALFTTLAASSQAAVFTFTTDPFAGSNAPTTPGRQIVPGEPSITFNTGSDLFAFLPAVFGAGNQVLFATGPAASLPTSGVNIIVLQQFDDDGNPGTPFGAGNAANLIAAQITAPGPGFFIYFNQGLNLPRLVFSADLNDNTADLAILARMTNLAGNPLLLANFTAANFAFLVAEPATLALFGIALLVLALRRKTKTREAD